MLDRWGALLLGEPPFGCLSWQPAQGEWVPDLQEGTDIGHADRDRDGRVDEDRGLRCAGQLGHVVLLGGDRGVAWEGQVQVEWAGRLWGWEAQEDWFPVQNESYQASGKDKEFIFRWSNVNFDIDKSRNYWKLPEKSEESEWGNLENYL